MTKVNGKAEFERTGSCGHGPRARESILWLTPRVRVSGHVRHDLRPVAFGFRGFAVGPGNARSLRVFA